MVLFWSQIGIAIVIFLISTIASWYEGSSILTDPWEWEHSTPFSQWAQGGVTGPNDISDLDHFVYAAKFDPFFPILMMLSVIYLSILIGYHFFKRRLKSLAIYIVLLGVLLLLAGVTIFNFFTLGGQVFFYLLLICAVICFVTSTLIYKKHV